MSEQTSAPRRARPPARLRPEERRRVALVGLAPVVAAVVVLTPVGLLTTATAREVLGAALAYGGLLGLVAAFVTVDRLHARQCPACHRRPERGAEGCACGYDLVGRPRYACDRRHAVYLEPGACDCGATLARLHTARGLGPQVVVALRIGAWLLVFLLAAGVVVHLLSDRL